MKMDERNYFDTGIVIVPQEEMRRRRADLVNVARAAFDSDPVFRHLPDDAKIQFSGDYADSELGINFQTNNFRAIFNL